MKKRNSDSAKNNNQKEIGRIKLSESQELVVSIVDNEKLDLRIFIDTEKYTGPTKRGLRFYMFDDNWEGFKKLIPKIDKIYQEIG